VQPRLRDTQTPLQSGLQPSPSQMPLAHWMARSHAPPSRTSSEPEPDAEPDSDPASEPAATLSSAAAGSAAEATSSAGTGGRAGRGLSTSLGAMGTGGPGGTDAGGVSHPATAAAIARDRKTVARDMGGS